MIKHLCNFIIAISLLLTLLSSTAFADGGFFYRLDYQLQIYNQNKQTCYINHNDNIQNMILSINLNSDFKGTDAVWIFPIPSNPSEAKINILSSYPQFDAYNIEDHYLKSVSEISRSIAATQLVHLPLYSFAQLDLTLSNGSIKINDQAKVLIHDRIEKFGLVTELISVKDLISFKMYLKNKKLNFPEKFNTLIGKYFNKEYSFVISYINDVRKIRGDIGVFISFPTTKIFFPLLLTSIYENLKFPIKLCLFGHYNPDLYSEIKNYSSIHHYFSLNYSVNDQLKEFFFNDNLIKYLKITTIDIDSIANNFVDDIWIEAKEPFSLTFADLMINHKYIIIILMLITISITSSIISGIGTFGYNKTNLMKFIILGISNIFSIITFSLLSISLFKRKQDKPINYKLIFITALIISTILFVLLFLLYRAAEPIFVDMGIERLSLYLVFFITYKYFYYFILFSVLCILSSIFIYGFVYDSEIFSYIFGFMVCVYIFSYLFFGYFFYDFNNYYKIVEARTISK